MHKSGDKIVVEPNRFFDERTIEIYVSNLTSLIKDRKEADFHWERRTVLGSSLLDLDTEEINQTIALPFYKNQSH